MKEYLVRFLSPAEDSIDGWKNASLPLGNGYMGVNVFGGVARDRLQLTEPTLVTGGTGRWLENRYYSGQESFGDLFFEYPDLCDVENYERTLSLGDAIARVTFCKGGVKYEREYFTSYPDRVGVVRLSASEKGKITVNISAQIAFVREHLPVEPTPPFTAKSGATVVAGDTLVASGISEYYGIVFEGQFCVLHQGGMRTEEGNHIAIKNADTVTVLYTLGTNYRLQEKTFLLPREEKLKGNPSPHETLTARLTLAKTRTYEALRARHIEDHSAFFSRTSIDLGGVDDGRTTRDWIRDYREGKAVPYLEELFFEMGRYMTIATSREGTLPPGLQGKWNAYEIAPWTAGYWYNINQQMNYWGVFSTDLAELYAPYLAFNLARLTSAQEGGDAYIRELHPKNYEEGKGKNGWIVATGNSAYTVGRATKNTHSGPGTGGFTVISDIDYYRFTREKPVLLTVYPILESLGRFYDKCLERFGEEYLVTYSASPEIHHEGKPYMTTGCAFDQQMIYETISSLIDMYDNYGKEIPDADTTLIDRLREKVDHLSPVLIGASGQVKEFREENFYGEIGDKHHRHISHLVGLYPGTVINESTPEWIEGAKKTLHFRGLDKGCGWSLAHKLGMWARVGDGEISHHLYGEMIRTHLFENLWNSHDIISKENFSHCVFQAEGNFGATAGVAEMLLCSSGKYICPLIALPKAWQNGTFDGLVARGNFVFGVAWQDGTIQRMTVTSRAGAPLRIRYPDLSTYRVTQNGASITPTFPTSDTLEYPTTKGDVFVFERTSVFSADLLYNGMGDENG